MENDIVEYLASKHLKVKQANATNVHLSCFFCGESDEARGRLYISTDPPNFWQCFLCGESGGLNKIRKHFGDAPIPFADTNHADDALPDDVLLAVFGAAADYYHSNLGVESFDYLRKTRGLENDTIQKFKLGWAEDGNNLVGHLLGLGHAIDDIKKTGLVDQFGNDALGGMITIPYMVMGNVVTIRGKNMGAKYMSLPHAKNRLFNVDALLEGDRTKAVICEGEFDAMTLHQLGFTAVGVPGAALFQDAWVDYFDETKRVYIAMDNDKAGKLGAEKTASKIGQKARIVEMPEGFDVNDWMVKEGKKWEDFDFLFNCAPGGLLVTVDQAYERWMEIEGNPDLVGLRFNVKSLDDEMRHGLTPGQVLTMIAKTNCLSGDTDMVINRGGAAKHYTLAEVVAKFEEWKSSVNEPMCQRLSEDGTVRLVKIKNAWSSGAKKVYRLTTAGGKAIKATGEHRFMTEDGFVRLKNLCVGDSVMVNGGKGGHKVGTQPRYRQKSGLTHHPFRTRRKIYPTRHTPGDTVQMHRVVMEAHLSGLSLTEFVSRCKHGDIAGLTFIDPKKQEVHHIDSDETNNDISNLKLLEKQSHRRSEHDFGHHVREHGVLDKVIGIEYVGMEETYDIEVEDDPHNFIADGFVVHNSGKTILTLNFFQRMALIDPEVKILFVSMEQSRNEWFERARRIHSFYDPWSEIPDTLNYWRPKLHLVDRNRLTEDELRGVVEQYAYEVGEVPDFVCVDYLGYYARSYKADSGYERTTAAIMSLKAIAREFNTVMYAPHQVNRTGAFGKELSADMAQESSAVEQTSDMMLAIWNPDQQLGVRPDDQQGLIHMKIVKSRDGAVGRELQFLFCPKTLALVPTDDAKHMTRAENERKCNGLAEQWEHMLYRHRTGDYSTHALDDLEVKKFLAEAKRPADWVDLSQASNGSTFTL